MSERLPNYTVRRAIIRKIGSTFVDCEFTDRRGEAIVRCPIPHLYANKSGGGVFVQPEIGNVVLISYGPSEQPFIVSVLPERELYFDQSGISDSSISTSSYPRGLKPGEIFIKGPTGSKVALYQNGNVSLGVGSGTKKSNLELSKLSDGLFLRLGNVYKFTEAGRTIEGVVKRDRSRNELVGDVSTFNFLDGEAYDTLLNPIGRSPDNEINYRTTTLIAPRVRNPSLIEKRSILYEYADSFNVRGLEEESDAMVQSDSSEQNTSFKNIVKDSTFRQARRTDILNLNLNNFNHLSEKVEGTLVDIYGNILDINRNIIPVPNITDIPTHDNTATKNELKKIYDHLRRSVKFHYEINSRKDIAGTEPSQSSADEKGKEFSKFSIDIDGEGLTKINIPASSETGNIPVLGRYINSRDPDNSNNGSFRDSKLKDIRLLPFSEDGPTIEDTTYNPETVSGSITAGTAHHNMLNVASSIFDNGKHGGDEGPITDTINNTIGDFDANAGGRSLHLNLDGSAEISIGADSVDSKSMVLDMAGSLISHFGSDNNGNSIIHQSDGNILIQVGGGSGPLSSPGRIEIHLATGSGDPQRIIIDEQGITIAVNGNAVYSSTGDTTISAGGRLLLHGEIVAHYGGHDRDPSGTRAVQGFERLVLRNGNIVI